MNPLGQMILDLFFLFDINVYNFSATLKNLFFCLKKNFSAAFYPIILI